MARRAGLWLAIAIVVAFAAPALGQGAGLHDVGALHVVGSGANPVAGSGYLNFANSNSPGNPTASGRAAGSSDLLTPQGYHMSSGSASGISKDLRIDPVGGSSVLAPVLSPITRTSSFGMGSAVTPISPASAVPNEAIPGVVTDNTGRAAPGELPSAGEIAPVVKPIVPGIGADSAHWPAGVPRPEEGGTPAGSPVSIPRNAIATPPFDLAGQLAINPRWQRGVEWLKRRQPAKALEPLRVGRVFAPDRAEGDWLLAVAQAGVDDDAAAVARLRDGLAVCPDLLAVPRHACDLLGSDIVDRRLAAVSLPADAANAHAADRTAAAAPKAPAERLIVLAWLAWDAGKVDTARELLSQLPDLAEPAATVADALRLAAGLPVARSGVEQPSMLTAGSPSAAAKAIQAASVDGGDSNRQGVPLNNWFKSVQGQYFGMPPVQVQFQYGRPVQPH